MLENKVTDFLLVPNITGPTFFFSFHYTSSSLFFQNPRCLRVSVLSGVRVRDISNQSSKLKLNHLKLRK